MAKMPIPAETEDDAVAPVGRSLRRDQPCLLLIMESARPLARGARWSLDGVDEIVVGRGERRQAVRERRASGVTLRVSVPDTKMSAVHARIVETHGKWVVEDANSRNGTFVRGERIARVGLEDGATLELGRTAFRVASLHAAAPIADIDYESAETEATGLATLRPEIAERHAALVRIARAAVPVLLQGETGTGKELLARAVHAVSRRRGRFVAVNCGAIAAGLVEAQLFGHVRGAFTGAVRDDDGLIRAADGGTLLLDEIGDLPLPAQAALLRVLQESEVVPVGSARAVKVDLRIVAATHRPLRAEVSRGAFRDDLLARLSGFTMNLTPLRARTDDLGIIVGDLLRVLAPQTASTVTFGPRVARALLAHDFPHNVRELSQVLATALALSEGGTIELEHFPPPIAARAVERASLEPSTSERDEKDERLRAAVVAALREHRGNLAAVARAMGKAPMQVHRWLKRFGIDPDTFRS